MHVEVRQTKEVVILDLKGRSPRPRRPDPRDAIDELLAENAGRSSSTSRTWPSSTAPVASSCGLKTRGASAPSSSCSTWRPVYSTLDMAACSTFETYQEAEAIVVRIATHDPREARSTWPFVGRPPTPLLHRRHADGSRLTPAARSSIGQLIVSHVEVVPSSSRSISHSGSGSWSPPARHHVAGESRSGSPATERRKRAARAMSSARGPGPLDAGERHEGRLLEVLAEVLPPLAPVAR